MLLRSTNNREENSPAVIFRDRPAWSASSDHHQLLKNPLGRDRMLYRGEFGAAVFEKRHSIRSRRAGKAFFEMGSVGQNPKSNSFTLSQDPKAADPFANNHGVAAMGVPAQALILHVPLH